jgi:very-short-patch-repair endonuclease
MDSVLRRLARDQWVRLHGTPRVTVLAGDVRAKQLWADWLALSRLAGTMLDGELDRDIRAAVARAADEPSHPIAVVASAAAIATWRAGRRDRLAAMVDEGLVSAEAPRNLDARSAAEAMLFEALESTPATTGRFRLNESLSVRFGPTAAEVDLLSRGDRIAIEIDGAHHFADLDRYRRDRDKDLLLQTQGLVVVRVLAEDVMRDARAVVSTVCRALAYRRQS